MGACLRCIICQRHPICHTLIMRYTDGVIYDVVYQLQFYGVQLLKRRETYRGTKHFVGFFMSCSSILSYQFMRLVNEKKTRFIMKLIRSLWFPNSALEPAGPILITTASLGRPAPTLRASGHKIVPCSNYPLKTVLKLSFRFQPIQLDFFGG